MTRTKHVNKEIIPSLKKISMVPKKIRNFDASRNAYM